MEYQNILFETDGNVAVVKINRPQKLNALNEQTLKELHTVFTGIKNNEQIYVAVLTGEGEKAFVAGADINELNQLDPVTAKKFAEFGQNVFNLIENLGKPVIAAVNGFALGGGCELALACHFRIASENAKFGQPEVNLGIIPGYGGTQRLARQINPGRAMQLILTGEMVDAGEAYRMGLVNEVVPQNELLNRAKEIAKNIASKGQIAIRYALQAVGASGDLSVAEGLKLEAALFSLCTATEDFKEGTSAFLEKRKPEFKGK